MVKRADAVDERDPVWIPSSFDPSLVERDLTVASSRLKVRTAMSRAIERVGSSAVTLIDLAVEIERDDALSVGGTSGLSRHVEALARTTFSVPGVGKTARVRPVVVALGVLDGRAYFTLGEERAAGEATIELLEVRAQLDTLRARRYVDDLVSAINVGVRVARVRSLAGLVRGWQARVRTLAGAVGHRSQDMALCRDLLRDLTEVDAQRAALDHRDEKAEVDVPPVGPPLWTAAEVAAAYRRLVPDARADDSPTTTAKLLGGDRVRLRNPDFTHQSARLAINAERMLYDRTDVLMALAMRCGGPVTHALGSAAYREIGLLRDVRPVLEAAGSTVAAERRAAAAALAFLQDPSSLPLVQHRLLTDSDAGTRQTAVWTLGAIGEDMQAHLERMRSTDDSLPLRNWADQSLMQLRFDPRGVWAL
jgi:hypothetical protein